MAPFRLGIMGFGRLAREYYCPALRGLDHVDQVLVADPLDRSRDAARRALPGAKVFADPAEVLAQRPDGIIIAAPPSSHLTLWRAAMRAGIPALVEKPFVLRGELPAATGTISEQRLLMVDFNRRFWGPYRRIAELVWGGMVGDVTRIELTLQVNVRPWCTVTSHRLDPAEGGALFDLGSQVVDLATWLLAREPSAVLAVTGSSGGPGDQVQIDLIFPGDVIARCRVGYGRRTEERLYIEGQSGRIRMADPNMSVHLERGRAPVPWAALSDLAMLGWRGVFRSRSMSRHSIARVIRTFVECVERSTPFTPGFAEAAGSSRLLEAAATSLTLGRPVPPERVGERVAHG
jgi:predicted dehydrogenase